VSFNALAAVHAECKLPVVLFESAEEATELACRIHEVPVSINDVARAASIDPAAAERTYHELCDRLPYSVCEDE